MLAVSGCARGVSDDALGVTDDVEVCVMMLVYGAGDGGC